MTYFNSFEESYEKTHDFIRFYNQERLHGSIGDIPPAEALEIYRRGDALNIRKGFSPSFVAQSTCFDCSRNIRGLKTKLAL